MKVVEKDRVINGMLQDEFKRCEEMLAALRQSLAALPKGVLSERKKRYKRKRYSYYSLKYRSGQKVINKHISIEEAPMLEKKLAQRKKIEKEARAYKSRMQYLSKILKHGRG